ncbi:TSC22 domain family protein 2-like isoform X2 [Lampris incognitus]|uniref:TSC22 domain family protein 2-like isoform X2 n=1 Tax=Lampris incognitus TaxID=2546036 RepID=UPI0024B5D38F|nr:TSC22 domain family protein 2-like isoform X2 [Lampris incognitus]
MSKMPAKKKSCFQITSVIQAQVAANSATDDTESLDDPDESRTEDVSSEIFDVSRADYEPVCDRSSSEEALNNVGEPEAPSGMVPQPISQVGNFSLLSSNPNGGIRKVGVAGSTIGSQQALGTAAAAATSLPLITQSGVIQQQAIPAVGGGATSVLANTSQPAPIPSSTPSSSTTTSTASCSSRFRVIKLDHGTGEPFRRGRWTCTEFYEKDSESSVASRTVDSIRHANVTVDTSADRDSGLGHTGGSVVTPATHSGQGLGSVADTSLSAPRMHSVETQQQHIHHQSYGTGQQGVSGTATQNAFSSSKPTVVPAQQQQPTAGGLQSSTPQNLLPAGQNGLPQGSIHVQKSPVIPLAAQPQPVVYSPQQQPPMVQQLPLGHHLAGQPSGLIQKQTEYYQPHQPASLQPAVTAGQLLPVANPSTGSQPVVQGPSPVMTPAVGGASVPSQVGEIAVTGGGSLLSSHTAPGLLLQQTSGGMGGVGASKLVGGSTLLQQSVGQYATSLQPQPHSLHPTTPSVQNVPAVTVNSSVPTAVPSASSAAMPNLTTSSLPPSQQSQLPCSSTGAPGGLGVQGLSSAGFGQVEAGSGRKSEGHANTQFPVISGKDLMKPLIPESLQLTTPTVNSLFGIPIPVDGDEDSASGTSVVAIDNKIEQAMDLVKSHLMYAVREEVEVLKEQIKELFERNSILERENAVLKSLANSEQLSQLSTQSASSSNSTPPQQGLGQAQPPPLTQLQVQAPTQPQPQIQPQPQSHPQQLQTKPQLDPSQQVQPNVTSA